MYSLNLVEGENLDLRVLIVHTGANSPNIEADLLECFKNIAFLGVWAKSLNYTQGSPS